MNTGSLVDFLQQYVNSIGVSTSLFAQQGDPLALDVILDNCEAISTIAAELQVRTRDRNPYTPVPNQHLQALTEEFLKRQGASPSSPS